MKSVRICDFKSNNRCLFKLPTALTGRQLKQSVKVFHNLKGMVKHGRVRSWLVSFSKQAATSTSCRTIAVF